MMDFIGKWKFKGINMPTPDGTKFFTRETATEDMSEIFDEGEQMLLEFCEDGTYNMIVEAVGEIAETAAEEGYLIREDGYAVVDTAKWEDRDGTIFYDSRPKALSAMKRSTRLSNSLSPKRDSSSITFFTFTKKSE